MIIDSYISNQSKIDKLYLQITGPADTETGITKKGTGIAEPGDLLFFITHFPHKKLLNELKQKTWTEKIKFRMREMYGYDRNDFDVWHVAIYLVGKKRKNHRRVNPWIVHSTNIKGVHKQQITPRSFSSEYPQVRRRMEILELKSITTEQRQTIIEYANSKVGSKFDQEKWIYKILPYALGLPNVFHNKDLYSCQKLIIAAYGAAGIYFPHPYTSFPFFNIGKYMGHPLGHPKEYVDPKYSYLRDHHIYRDKRFVLKAAVYQDHATNEIILQTKDLKKYSWNEELRDKYIERHYIDQ